MSAFSDATTDSLPAVAAWFGVWWLIYAFFHFVVFSGLKSSARKDAAVSSAGIIHAVFCVVNVYRFLASEEGPGLRHDLYGHSEIAQKAFTVTIGFMVWHVAIELVLMEKVDPAMLAHGVLCALVFLLGLHPFLHHMGTLMLAFEFSTLFLNTRHMLLSCDITEHPLLSLSEVLFTLAFIVVRIVIGLPVSFVWWGDMIHLLSSGTYHSLGACLIFLAANTVLNGLNLYWAYLIVGKMVRKFGPGRRHEQPPGSAAAKGKAAKAKVR